MKNLIVANWKMNPTSQKEAKNIFDSIKKGIKKAKNAEVVICPPFTWLTDFSHKNKSAVSFGAQNCFWEEKGAFTGEISPQMLKSSKVEYVIIGHSERRKYFNETNEQINKKIKKCLEVGLKVILCIGETLEERERGETESVLKTQLETALGGISVAKLDKKLSVAYEPVWAISGGDPYKTKELPTTEKVEKIYFYIKSLLAKIYNQNKIKDIRIIYGGSANAQNASGYLKESRMQGLLVGGASLDPEEFIKIVKSADN